MQFPQVGLGPQRITFAIHRTATTTFPSPSRHTMWRVVNFVQHHRPSRMFLQAKQKSTFGLIICFCTRYQFEIVLLMTLTATLFALEKYHYDTALQREQELLALKLRMQSLDHSMQLLQQEISHYEAET